MLGVVLPWSAGVAVLACFAAWMLVHGQFLGFATVWLGFVLAWGLATVVFLLHRVSTRRRPSDAAP
jgi:Na+-driven multidrug efflux pump